MKEISVRKMNSNVTVVGNHTVFKRQPKYLTDNEIFALKALEGSGYVPLATQEGNEVIRMEYLGRSEEVDDQKEFLSHYRLILKALANANIRHGDLTRYALIIKNNRPIMIDFGESRYFTDPRPDKRRGGDAYWLAKTMANLVDWDWHNGRCDDMWESITNYVNFERKSVLDLGCGYGDFSIRALMEGAFPVTAIDHDPRIMATFGERIGGLPIRKLCRDLTEWLCEWKTKWDIIMCFSVLPYVDTEEVMRLMSERSEMCLIECQYAGDGPGNIENDAEMYMLLTTYWDDCEPIGYTNVKEGRFKRTIWRCQ